MGGLFKQSKPLGHSPQAIGAIRIQSSAYGLPVPIVYGRNRITGNLVWYGDFQAISHTATQSSGGKGGGSAAAPSETTYTYTAALAFGLCEGPINAVQTVWSGKVQNTLTGLGLSLFKGTYPQTPWGYLTTYHAGQDIGYQGLAYAAAAPFNLGGNADLPNLSFEMDGRLPYGGTVVDSNPKDVVSDFLTNANYGAGFPSGKLGDLTRFSSYCVANGIFISPVINEQKPAHEYLTELSAAANSALVYSEGVLKIIPYGDEAVTGNGVTFTPNLTPMYDLTDDDFKGDKTDPIKCARKTPADAFNHVQVEFLNRANNYNIEIAEAKDQANIEMYGLRPMEVVKLHSVCDPAVARAVAQLILQRALYIRNTYEFRISWKYCLLEPMDIVTLTDSLLGLDKAPVRVTEIEEDESGSLTVKAEEFPAGVSAHALYSSQASGGYNANYNASPGNVNAPVIFEAPDILTDNGLEIWMAISGGAFWGGCEVWASLDDATFRRVGKINGGARHGVLSTALPNTADPDRTNTLGADLTVSRGALISGTQTDADTRYTLCYADGELISFQTATLTAQYKYNLNYLRRGVYGTAVMAHNAGTQFARLDQAVFRYPFTQDMIGKPLYLKFLSFNVYGGGLQALADVQAYTYNIQGTALKSPLPNIQNLVNYYSSGQTMLSWDPVVDFRPVDYEVRKGTLWDTAQVLGRTPNTGFTADGDGTYWVSAHYGLAYSLTPASIAIAGAVLVKNVIATYDEAAGKWGGSYAGGAAYDGLNVYLGGVGLFGAIPLMSAEKTIAFYGGVASSGTYEIPSNEVIDIGAAQACTCSVSYIFRADNPYILFSAAPLVSSMASVMGNYAGLADVKIQVNIAQNDGVFIGWKDFVPGQYMGRKFKFRSSLSSSDPSVTAVLSSMVFTVDVPDRIDKGTANCPAGGFSVVYSIPFHNPANDPPKVQTTLLNAQQGDDVVLSAETSNGFTVQVKNGGAGVVRDLNWLAQGY